MAYLGSQPSDAILTSADIPANTINASHLANSAVDLPTADVTGILPVSKGGTGTTTLSGLVGLVNAPWQIKTANYTAVAGDRLMTNTTAGAFTITLPVSPVAGDEITISDYARKFSTKNLTLARNGKLIEGLAEDFVLDLDGETRTAVYIDTVVGWKIV